MANITRSPNVATTIDREEGERFYEIKRTIHSGVASREETSLVIVASNNLAVFESGPLYDESTTGRRKTSRTRPLA